VVHCPYCGKNVDVSESVKFVGKDKAEGHCKVCNLYFSLKVAIENKEIKLNFIPPDVRALADKEGRDLESDLSLLADAFISNLEMVDGGENCYVGLNPKRPFGNSDVLYDVRRIIGLTEEDDELGDRHPTFKAKYRYSQALYHEALVPFLKNRLFIDEEKDE